MHKILRSFTIAVALLLTTALIAQAGGWAVITIDELPAEIVAGQTFSIGFTVRQHGQTLRSDLQPIVRFDRAGAQESFQVTAQHQGGEGHYVAAIKFPSTGQWEWRVDIEQFGMITQPMPALTVKTASAKAQPASFTGIIEFIRSIRRALLGNTSGGTAPMSLTVAKTTQVDQVALGQALFSAKGCVMCHVHDAVKVENGPFWSGEVEPPNLSEKSYGTEYLRMWLHDPQAVKPQTRMPKIELNDGETEALIAFLQAAH